MPSITKRKDGRWMVQTQIHGKRHYKYFHTRAEARAYLSRLEDDLERGKPPTGFTVAAWMTECIEAYGTYLSIDTVIGYKSVLRVHVLPEPIGKIDLEDLRSYQIQRWVDGMKHLAPKTVHNAAGVLHWVLEKAVQNQLIDRNPMTGVILPQRRKARRRVLSPDVASQLIGAMIAEDWRDLPLWLFIASTGCRLSEALGLAEEDLDLNTGRYTIRQTVTTSEDRKTAVIQRRTKTANAARSGIVPPQVVAQLRKLHAFRLIRKEQAGKDWEEHGLVFCDELGRPFRRNVILRRFYHLQERHGIPQRQAVGAHAFRHLVATMLLRSGISEAAVAKQMGHYSPAYTRAQYMDAYASDEEQIAQVTGAFLTASSPSGAKNEKTRASFSQYSGIFDSPSRFDSPRLHQTDSPESQ